MLASGAVSVVQPQRSGMASGANNTFRQVGIATGIAVLGAVFQSQILAHTTSALNKSAFGPEILRHGGAQLQGAMAAGGVRAALPSIPTAAARQALLDAYQVGFSATLNHLMDIGAVVALVGADLRVRAGAPARLHHPDRRAGGRAARSGCGRSADGSAPGDASVPAVHA